jgi:hypothetical protein
MLYKLNKSNNITIKSRIEQEPTCKKEYVRAYANHRAYFILTVLIFVMYLLYYVMYFFLYCVCLMGEINKLKLKLKLHSGQVVRSARFGEQRMSSYMCPVAIALDSGQS